MSAAAVNVELQHAAVKQHCKALRMPTTSAQFIPGGASGAGQANACGLPGSATFLRIGRAGEEYSGTSNPGSAPFQGKDDGRVRLLKSADDFRRANARLGRGRLHCAGGTSFVHWGLRNRKDASVEWFVRGRLPVKTAGAVHDASALVNELVEAKLQLNLRGSSRVGPDMS